MEFKPEQLIKVRKKMGITKAEAARRLNMSAMGYGRYENGDRTPSYQTLVFIAQNFNTTMNYLCGDEESHPDSILITQKEDPDLFELIHIIRTSKEDTVSRLRKYLDSI